MKQKSDVNQLYDFLKEINKFKSVERLSLVKTDGRRESDAEHTWHLVMAVWLYSYSNKKIDLLKAIKLALVHDLVEIYAGDVYGGAMPKVRSTKENKEKEAAEKLFSQLPAVYYQEFSDLWKEYELRQSIEARYVWALDKIAPRFQLTITKTDLAKNMPTDNNKIKAQEEMISRISPILKRVLKNIRQDRGIAAS